MFLPLIIVKTMNKQCLKYDIYLWRHQQTQFIIINDSSSPFTCNSLQSLRILRLHSTPVSNNNKDKQRLLQIYNDKFLCLQVIVAFLLKRIVIIGLIYTGLIYRPKTNIYSLKRPYQSRIIAWNASGTTQLLLIVVFLLCSNQAKNMFNLEFLHCSF